MSRLTLKLAQVGVARSAVGDSASNDVAEQNKRTFVWPVANSCALTNVDESPIVQVMRDCTVKAVRVIASSSSAANDTNQKTYTLAKRTGSGNAATIATANTGTNVSANQTNGHTAFVPSTIAITNANAAILSAGDVLTFKGINSGTGLGMSSVTSTALVEVDVEEDNR